MDKAKEFSEQSSEVGYNIRHMGIARVGGSMQCETVGGWRCGNGQGPSGREPTS